QRCDGTALLEPLLEIACLVELGMQPGRFKSMGVGHQFVVAAASLQGLKSGFGGQGARFNGSMTALDARCIQHPGLTADQYATGETKLGYGQQAAGRQGAGTVCNTFAAFKGGANGGVGLITLELFKW